MTQCPPQVSLLDACRSNQHQRGILARGVRFKYKTCEELSDHLQARGARRARGERVQDHQWPW